MSKTAASVRALTEALRIDEATAERIRAVWRGMPRETLIAEFPHVADYVRACVNPPATMILRRMAVDKLADTHGVEHLGIHRRTGLHVYYCNAGDTYAATVLFHGKSLRVGCWGDLVERNKIREE
jgi:hypothetical protein